VRALSVEIRTLKLLSLVLDLPLLAPALRLLTAEPRVANLTIAGVPVEVVQPGFVGPWPAVVFVNGAHPLRRREAIVQRLSRGLARAGYVVFVPDLPGLGEGEISLRTLESLVVVTSEVLDSHDIRNTKVALVGASTGASLALIAAARPALAHQVSVVVAVAPYGDLEKIVCLVTTGFYEENGGFVPYAVTPLARRIIARSLIAALDPVVRAQLFAELDRTEGDIDPRLWLEGRGEVDTETRAVIALLTNRDPNQYRPLWRELPPEISAILRHLSPTTSARDVRAPVEVLVPPSDVYFPPAEASALAHAVPTARLTVTATLDHTRPRFSLAQLGDFASFLRSVIRSLAQAG
jgi:pimeloyl-ACP methyl ester carboxylesterase